MYNSKATIVYSQLNEAAPASIRCWYLARAIDHQGRGAAELDVSQAAQVFNCSEYTIKRQLRELVSLGCLRRVNWLRRGVAQVWYSSILVVARRFKLEKLGYAAEVLVSDLRKYREASRIVQAEGFQSASRFAARKAQKGRIRRKVYRAEDLICTSQKSRGVKHRSQRCIFVGPDFVPFGASQQAIAQSLGRCTRTIRRSLSGVEKRRLMQCSPQNQLDAQISSQDWEMIAGRFYWFEGLAYRSLCNLYLTGVSLRTKRRLKDRHKRMAGVDMGFN